MVTPIYSNPLNPCGNPDSNPLDPPNTPYSNPLNPHAIPQAITATLETLMVTRKAVTATL